MFGPRLAVCIGLSTVSAILQVLALGSFSPVVHGCFEVLSVPTVWRSVCVHGEDEVGLRRGDHCWGQHWAEVLRFTRQLWITWQGEVSVLLNELGGGVSLQRIMNHFPRMTHRINLRGNGRYYPVMSCFHLNICTIFPQLHNDHIPHLWYLQPHLGLGVNRYYYYCSIKSLSPSRGGRLLACWTTFLTGKEKAIKTHIAGHRTLC